jgi:hypothetical protein
MLLLYGAGNWLDLNTHEPYRRIENHPLFYPLVAHFQTASPGLVDSIRAMEDLTPKTQFLKGTLVEGRNPEYPYIDVKTFALECPEAIFSQADSEQFYHAARQVVEVVRSLSSVLQALGLRLPRRI